MPTIKPFAALRPKPELAARICELPYDVMSSEEARVMASGNPLSFLRVSKPEIDLAPGISLYSDAVYAKGAENFNQLIQQGALVRDAAPAFYVYRQIMGQHEQIGLVALASCEEYRKNIVKRHELTRPDKEDDRVRHIEAMNSQTGPAFLTYRAVPAVDAWARRVVASAPDVDFVGADGIRHSSWSVRSAEDTEWLTAEFSKISALYIADGHHRSAAAARVAEARGGRGTSGYFLSVIFPHNQMQIMPYNRALKDLNGRSMEQFLHNLESIFTVTAGTAGRCGEKHELGLYIGGLWHHLKFRPAYTASKDPVERLDVTLLQNFVLGPLLGIDNPRTSSRIAFVGGIRGPGELETMVNSGEYACAFSMYPTGIEDLMEIADAGGIMPPKSTWFEPKLRDAMFCHVLD